MLKHNTNGSLMRNPDGSLSKKCCCLCPGATIDYHSCDPKLPCALCVTISIPGHPEDDGVFTLQWSEANQRYEYNDGTHAVSIRWTNIGGGGTYRWVVDYIPGTGDVFNSSYPGGTIHSFDSCVVTGTATIWFDASYPPADFGGTAVIVAGACP